MNVTVSLPGVSHILSHNYYDVSAGAIREKAPTVPDCIPNDVMAYDVNVNNCHDTS